jgi:hypothetical protein
MRSAVNVGANGGRNADLIDCLRCCLVIGRRHREQSLQDPPSYVVRSAIFRYSQDWPRVNRTGNLPAKRVHFCLGTSLLYSPRRSWK